MTGCKGPEKEERSGKTVRRQPSLFVPERRSGKRKNTKTLNTRTLYGKGNARKRLKGQACGDSGLRFGGGHRVFCGCEWSEMPLERGFCLLGAA